MAIGTRQDRDLVGSLTLVRSDRATVRTLTFRQRIEFIIESGHG